MKRKTKIIISIVVATCLIILIIDIFYIIYMKNVNKVESKYFDSINAFTDINNEYIAVGSNNNNEKLYEKAKITKYDTKYEKVWEKLFNKGYNSSFFNIVSDKDAYIAVGSYEKDKKEHEEKVTTALLVKYDKDGTMLFNKTLQILGDSVFRNVQVVDDGYIVVGQSIYEKSTLGMGKDGGAIIIKYDKSGNELWRHNYGGNKSGIYNDLLVTDDAIYTVGKDYGRVGIISRYNLDGEYIKTNSYEFTDTIGFTGIARLDDELVVVGSKKVKEEENNPKIDALVVKYDMNCEYLNEITYDNKGLERYNNVIVDDKDNIIIIGHSAIKDKKKSTKDKNVYTYDGILAKYKSDLTDIYTEKYGNEYNDYFTDIKIVKDNYLISGYSNYKNEGYLSKFITYSSAGKSLEVK